MKPLTIEQLKSLEVGDWVWIVVLKSDCINKAHNGKYYHIQHCGSFGDKELWCGWQGYGTAFEYSDYGTKWIAYKNKEQAEAKGEIVELPCKVGVPIYVIRNLICDMSKYGIYKVEYTEISITREGMKVNEVWDKTPIAMFDTQEEAEARLQELRGEK